MGSAYVREPGQLLEPAPELLERVRDTAKLHRELVALDREDGVVGGVVEVAPERRELAAAQRPANAAGVEDDPLAEPPLPLDVRVAGRERGRVAEELVQLGLARVRVDLLQERGRRPVHAQEPSATAEVEQARSWTPRSRSISRSASANSARSSAIVGSTATAGTIGSQKLKTR